ncbi:hypothetical protein QUA54_31475 [Microcoleus sp. MOSTC5]|uniref:plasmid replication protein, CyRepA1 family n=1 Tax=Microcoleus sp. MOSTC5 TaxID=3055378 RepID=UPI002FD5006B
MPCFDEFTNSFVNDLIESASPVLKNAETLDSSSIVASHPADEQQDYRFYILDHLDKLEPAKAPNFYTCPVCEGHRLGINPKTGAYRCWSGECSSIDIREAIRPMAEFLAELEADKANKKRPARQARKAKAQKKEYPAAPIPVGAKLLRLPAPGQPPRAERPTYFPKGVPTNAAQIIYKYSNTQEVLRFEWVDPKEPKGRDKTYRQTHIDSNGKKVWNEGTTKWQPYRIDEVLEAIKSVPDDEVRAVVLQEGEPSVELARSISLASITLRGNTWNDAQIERIVEALRLSGKNIVLVKVRDNDQPGILKAAKVQETCNRLEFPCIVVDPRRIHPDIPEAGDIREILEAIGEDEFLSRLEAEIALKSILSEPSEPVENATEATSIPFETDSRYTRLLRRWKRARAYVATVLSDSEFVQLPEPGPNTITAIKAGLGRGKTEWLAWLTATLTLGKFFLLGHRNALLRGTSKRCRFYHIKYDEGQIMLSDPNGRVASCVDSLLKFMDDCANENCTIVLDEVESVVRHILTGNTISASDRIAILDKFALLLNSCSRIILMDGHLTDATIDYITSLAPGKTLTKYENTFKATLPKIEIFRSSGAPLKASEIESFKDLILNAERPAVFCDCKDDAIALYKLLEEIHGEGTGLLLTADNSTEDWQAEFTDEPDESIRLHQWKFIVASPLIESGVNVSVRNYFSEVFGMFGGVVSVNSVAQMIRRVRHPIGGIKILCASRVRPSADGDDIYTHRMQQRLAERMTADIAEFDERSDAEIHTEILEELKACVHHTAWFRLKCLEHIERPYFYEFVCELLRESGHEVIELDIENAFTEAHKQAKEEVRWEYAEAVANAEIIPITTAERILKSHTAKKAEILSATRAVYNDQLPGIEITPSLVHRLKKERNLLPSMRNLCYFQNPDKAKQLREYRWEEGRIKVFGSDYKPNSLMLRALQDLDIGKFLDCSRTFRKDSVEVLEVAKWGRGKEAARAGLKIGGQTPIQYLQTLLSHLGIKLIGNQRKGQQREYSYRPEGGSLPEGFNRLYAAVSSKMLEKWQEKIDKKEAEKRLEITPQTIDSTSVEAVTPLPNILYSNVGRGATEIEATQEVIAQGENMMALDPQAHQECVEFIRTALVSSDDPQTACDVASVVKEVCASGHADRAAIWADLSEVEREQFRSLLATASSCSAT